MKTIQSDPTPVWRVGGCKLVCDELPGNNEKSNEPRVLRENVKIYWIRNEW